MTAATTYLGRPPIEDAPLGLESAPLDGEPSLPVASALVPPAGSTVEKPYTLLDFRRMFPDEQACIDYLFHIRWSNGFTCPKCGETRYYWMQDDPAVVQCPNHHRTSMTAGTAMHKSKQSLTLWFHAAYLVSTLTPGISALQFQKQLAIKRYETAYNLLHKLRSVLVAPEREKLRGVVEVDEAFVGGPEEGRRGRGAETKVLVICGVEVVTYPAPDPTQPDNPNAAVMKTRAGRVRLSIIPDAEAATLLPWVEANIEKGATVNTDGWSRYAGLAKRGYTHKVTLQTHKGKKTGRYLPLVHLIVSNLKRWLLGTHKGAVLPKHLQAYLNEFTFRFNRRFWRGPAFLRALGLVVSSECWPEYETLYHAGGEGGWLHPDPIGEQEVFDGILTRMEELGRRVEAMWLRSHRCEVLPLARERLQAQRAAAVREGSSKSTGRVAPQHGEVPS